MGNQLTGIAPSQILPVDHYLTDVANYEFDIRWWFYDSVMKSRFLYKSKDVSVIIDHSNMLYEFIILLALIIV